MGWLERVDKVVRSARGCGWWVGCVKVGEEGGITVVRGTVNGRGCGMRWGGVGWGGVGGLWHLLGWWHGCWLLPLLSPT